MKSVYPLAALIVSAALSACASSEGVHAVNPPPAPGGANQVVCQNGQQYLAFRDGGRVQLTDTSGRPMACR